MLVPFCNLSTVILLVTLPVRELFQMRDLATAKKFEFVGGDLSLDFCNTMGGKRGGITREHLVSWFEYVAWCHQAGLLDAVQAKACVARAELSAATAEKTLARAIALREAIFRIFAAIIASKPTTRPDLALLNSELARSLGRLRVVSARSQASFAWAWSVADGLLDEPLGPIADAAATLLTSPDSLTRLRACNGDNCGWLFIDGSKNHSRRWCDMRDCGNRAKIRRHRLKQRAV
jgi:predicted RNA-binding Zn ribbon-like protein